MLKNVLSLGCLFFAMVLLSCAKEENTYDRETQLQLDIDSIARFVSINKIVATKDKSGLYFQILRPGAGEIDWDKVESVTVKYTGRLLNGAVFDKPELPVKLLYSGLFQGWRDGLQKIKEGGNIRLIIPSTMAYTDVQVGIIAPNSNLDYTIELLKIDLVGTKTEN